jgi:uracil-DNA glycosylase family 4
MSDYLRVLEGAEQHLRALKASGVRFLTVATETLNSLSEPPTFSKGKSAGDKKHSGINGISAPPGVGQSSENEGITIPSYDGIAVGKNKEVQKNVARLESMPEQAVKTLGEGGRGNDDIQSYDSMLSAGGMDDLRQRTLSCLKCPHLVKSRKNVVFGVGDIHARLMFVGEAPGADEDAQGEPFVGAAGQLLTRIIQTMGLSRESVYIANILKCRPDTPGQSFGNRKPTPDEMKTCLPYLLAQIDLIRPAVIVALGSTAVEGLLGKSEGIGKLRGKFHTFRETPLMPTFHPSYLLRNQALTEKRKVWEDMLQVMQKLEMPISEKQNGYFLKQ